MSKKPPLFTDQEIAFFRDNFPRLDEEGVISVTEGKNCKLIYEIHPAMSQGVNGSTLFNDKDFLIWLNLKRKKRAPITLVHEVLHAHYEDPNGIGKPLYDHLCEKYGEHLMHPISFLRNKEIYYGKWEPFLNQEARLIYKGNPDIVRTIKRRFKEETHRGEWKSSYVRTSNGFKEICMEPFEGAVEVRRFI